MVLFYFMDGLRLDLAKKHMPALAGLNILPLRSELGYSCACHASMYTGLSVNEHGTWFIWKRGENSPYRFLDSVPLVKHADNLAAKYLAAKTARLLNRCSAFSGIPMLVSLPLRYWSSFELCETEFWTSDSYMTGRTTLFKLLRENGVRHSIIGLGRGSDVFSDEAAADYKNDDFIYYFIGDVDSYMHRYGCGEESVAYLRKVDAFIAGTVNKARAAGREPTVICCSDHGHIPVREKLDPNSFFRRRGLDIDSYLHLTESTFLRFWPDGDRDANEIKAVLEDMCEAGLGVIVDAGMRQRYALPSCAEHGELIFSLYAPRIFTNTIWGYGKTVRSMHGYLPELEEHLGVFASNRPLRRSGFALLQNVLPTLTGALGLKTPVPGGESLIVK